jgi:hypothetical protein
LCGWACKVTHASIAIPPPSARAIATPPPAPAGRALSVKRKCKARSVKRKAPKFCKAPRLC